ncbi:phytanoyl-CoA dioxygenase [Marinomonas primoryensis]|uniref:Phytanoyl-CoA dioxygenase n=1 Tax=Marinomonas primoryensis TaxID=178399 RepID=A0A2Z4PMC8_9GAMM|nr:phytanoyl-CoA dioxygenase family protein [Marinomonas primoryensis]AWX98602.1 phytanoyl-CoA dioxygenase [Marinomonas primoryensis]
MKLFSTFTPSEIELLPTDEDIKLYQQNGWYISKKIFTDEELDQLIVESKRYYSGVRDQPLPMMPKSIAYWTPDDGNVARNNDYIHYESNVFREILTKPLLGAISARLAQTDEVRIWNSALITKPAIGNFEAKGMFRPIVPWHKDAHYWSTCSSNKLLTAFINFYDCDEDGGALHMIDGSSNWVEEQSNDSVTKHFGNRSLSELQAMIEKVAQFNGDTVRKVPMITRRGQVSFHSCHTFHGSGPNNSNQDRVSISLHMQDKENDYKNFTLSNGEKLIYNNDYFVRKTINGNPDYSDENFCPIIWREGVNV